MSDILAKAYYNSIASTGMKPKGWHSRRHQTRAEQDAARQKWQSKKSNDAKRALSDVMRKEREIRGDMGQLAIIGSRRGVSHRERERIISRKGK